MQRAFHIFRQMSDGAFLWVEAAFSLDEAMRRLDELAKVEPAMFAIFDVSSGGFVVPFERSVSPISQPSYSRAS